MNDDISAMLDATLDDLADLPTFKPFPAGTHIATVKFETKTKQDPKDKSKKEITIHCHLKAVETVELANSEDTALAAGDETSVMFQLSNEFGQGALKNLLNDMSSVLALPTGGTLRQIMEAADGNQFTLVTQTRENKNNKDQKFTQIVSVGK